LYLGCATRRSTCTTTVLLGLSLTTSPMNSRAVTSLLLLRPLGGHDRFDARKITPDLADARSIGELTRRLLEAQAERFLAQLQRLRLQLVGRLALEVFTLHR